MTEAPEQLPATPEEAAERVFASLNRATRRALGRQSSAWKTYRKHTRPFRRAFRGIYIRKDMERMFISRAQRTARAIQKAQEAQGDTDA